MNALPVWSVPREWSDQTAFIIAGGPSVALENVEALRGRNVIVVNSSYEVAPWAPFLIFGDAPWFHLHFPKLKGFSGRIVTTSISVRPAPGRSVLILKKKYPPPGLSANPSELVMQKTTLHGAINMAVHLGVKRIVLLGADMGPSPDGKTHHHSAHPRAPKPGCYDEHMEQLKLTVDPLQALGIEVVNTSMSSRLPFWKKVPLTEVLAS